LIPSCRLDEYRLLGGLLTPLPSREGKSTVAIEGEAP
jgi:hypothetical protein